MKRGWFETPEESLLAKYIPVTESGCWLWTHRIHNSGYGELSFKGQHHLAHRLSYACFVGTIPVGMDACHSCDTRICINPSHLFLGSRFDNMADMRRKNRGRLGHKHWRVELGEEQVIEVYSSTESAKSIALRFGVSPATIYDIRRGTTWSWLTGAVHPSDRKVA